MLVVLFVPDQVHGLELTGIEDALFETNQRLPPERHYHVRTVGAAQGALQCASGLKVIVDDSIADQPEPPDTLIVVGTFGIPPDPSASVVDWIRRSAAPARRYGSSCTGAFLLGAAGLIDGHRVTTHWQFADDLASRHPTARVEPDLIFVRDGKLFTSAGSSAAIDLALALIEEDHGRAMALWVARRLVVYLKRPGGQSQYSVHLATQAALRSPVERVQQAIRDDPSGAHTLPEMARIAGMSPRNFSRVFRRETHLSPASFVELTRIEVARRLLEEGQMAVQQVLRQSGFASPALGRRAFLRRLGLSPSEYRRRFRSTTDC